VIDTGYGPRVPEIRSAIAWALHQSPRWRIDTHGHFDHTDGNSTFAEDQTTVVGHANCRARMSQDQFVPSLEWSVRSSPRSAWPGLTFNAAVSIDLASQTLELIPQEPAHTDGDVVVWLPSAKRNWARRMPLTVTRQIQLRRSTGPSMMPMSGLFTRTGVSLKVLIHRFKYAL